MHTCVFIFTVKLRPRGSKWLRRKYWKAVVPPGNEARASLDNKTLENSLEAMHTQTWPANRPELPRDKGPQWAGCSGPSSSWRPAQHPEDIQEERKATAPLRMGPPSIRRGGGLFKSECVCKEQRLLCPSAHWAVPGGSYMGHMLVDDRLTRMAIVMHKLSEHLLGVCFLLRLAGS